MRIVLPSHMKTYDLEGFMILPSVISKDTLEMLREECSLYLGYADAALDARGVQSDSFTHRGRRYFIANRYRLSARIWEFLFGPLMGEVAEATVGPDAYLFHEQWVVKGAEHGMSFSWHQDSGYVKRYHPTTDHKPYVTCWCALDDVSEANGTIHLLPYSRSGTRDIILNHEKDLASGDLVASVGNDLGDAVSVPSGSIVAFTSRVLHRSGPNTSKRMRRIYLVQYSGAPIMHPDGMPWSMAVPFLKGGKLIYDHAVDTCANWGPVEREDGGGARCG